MDKQFTGKVDYYYDSLNRLVGVRSGENVLTKFIYDPAGNIVNIGKGKPEDFKEAEDQHPADNSVIQTDPLAPALPSSTDPSIAAQEQDWYISRGEEQYGPYSDEDMFSFAQQGHLHPEDLIWSEDTGDWVRADSVGIFFAK